MADNVDLAELEMAFAKDPSSDAFLALSQAYLDQGRFMEAMVVCKKGIRSQPDSLLGRLLLAKVYAGQGKVPKAIEEVKALLEKDEGNPEAHFFLGQLHERSGRFEEAIDAFKEALILDRGHEAAKEALKAKGIDFDPGPSEAELAAQREAEEAAQRQAAEEQARAAAEAQAAAQAAQASGVRPAMNGGFAQPPTTGGFSTPPTTGGFSPPPTTGGFRTPTTGGLDPGFSQPMPVTQPGAYANVGYFSGYDPLAEQHKGGRKLGLGFSFGLGALLLMCVAGLILFLRANKAEAEKIAALQKDAAKGFTKETTYGLKLAAEKYKQVLQIDDDHELAVARLAWIFQTLRWERDDVSFDKDAEETLARAQKVAPDHPLTVAATMINAIGKRKPAEAMAAYETYKRTLKDGEAPAQPVEVARGRALVAQGQMEALRPLLEQLKTSDKPGTLAFAGEGWRRLGDELQAAIALDNALRYEPDHDPARAQRALLLLEIRDLGRVDVVLSDVKHILDLGKQQIGPRQRGYAILARAEFNRLVDKEDDAKADLTAAKAELRRDPELSFVQARWDFADGKDEDGLKALQESLDLDPNRVRPWAVFIEEAAEKRSGRDDAEKAFDQAHKIFGDHPLLVTARVLLLGRNKKLDEAGRYLKELIEKNPDSPELLREQGRVYLAQKETKKAVATLQEAAKKSKDSPKLSRAETLTLLGRALAEDENHAEAVNAYSEAIKAAGSFAPAYYYLGKSFKAQEQDGPAREAFERAAKLDPTSSMGKAAKRAAEKL